MKSNCFPPPSRLTIMKTKTPALTGPCYFHTHTHISLSYACRHTHSSHPNLKVIDQERETIFIFDSSFSPPLSPPPRPPPPRASRPGPTPPRGSTRGVLPTSLFDSFPSPSFKPSCHGATSSRFPLCTFVVALVNFTRALCVCVSLLSLVFLLPFPSLHYLRRRRRRRTRRLACIRRHCLQGRRHCSSSCCCCLLWWPCRPQLPRTRHKLNQAHICCIPRPPSLQLQDACVASGAS